jgi:Carboxypeptidase regulatory-like domain
MHRMQHLLALAAACSLALAATELKAQAPAAAEGQTGAISGRVTTGKGYPLWAAHVDITDQTTGQSYATLTRQDGQYTVWRLPLGHVYEVLIRSVGFAPLRHAVSMPDPGTPDALADPVVNAVLLPIDRPWATTAMQPTSKRKV